MIFGKEYDCTMLKMDDAQWWLKSVGAGTDRWQGSVTNYLNTHLQICVHILNSHDAFEDGNIHEHIVFHTVEYVSANLYVLYQVSWLYSL